VERQALSEICAYTGGMMFFIYALTKFLIGWITEQQLTRRLVQRLYIFDSQNASLCGGNSNKKVEAERGSLTNNATDSNPQVVEVFTFTKRLQ
jgi:hypothetical protein